MTPLTSIELNTTQGGRPDFAVGEFLGGLIWVLGGACAATANPAVCGMALVVGGVNVVFF